MREDRVEMSRFEKNGEQRFHPLSKSDLQERVGTGNKNCEVAGARRRKPRILKEVGLNLYAEFKNWNTE